MWTTTILLKGYAYLWEFPCNVKPVNTVPLILFLLLVTIDNNAENLPYNRPGQINIHNG